MQAVTTRASFERERAAPKPSWLRWLPGAVRDHALALPAPGRAVVDIGAGTLELRWHDAAAAPIALVQLPRLAVRFRFDGVDDAARQALHALLRPLHAARRRLNRGCYGLGLR